MDLGRLAGGASLTRTQRQIEEHRKEDAVIEVRDEAGRPCPGRAVWVEQEAHEFLFGCVLPDAELVRCRDRLNEVFNHFGPGEDALRVEFMDRVHLGTLRRELDRQSAAGRPLEVHVCGRTAGLAELSEQDGARRLADLYTLCFANPWLRGLFWHGVRDGEGDVGEGGVLRRDLSPKPALRVLQKLIGVVWHSRAAGTTDAAGRFLFRGFRGTYRVGVMAGEQAAKVGLFSLSRGLPGGYYPNQEEPHTQA